MEEEHLQTSEGTYWERIYKRNDKADQPLAIKFADEKY